MAQEYLTQTKGKVLGLTIGRTGITQHVYETHNKGKTALKEIRRFKSLPINIKLHLIKAYILPVLQYTPIPLVTLGKCNERKLQRTQNSALRFAYSENYP